MRVCARALSLGRARKVRGLPRVNPLALAVAFKYEKIICTEYEQSWVIFRHASAYREKNTVCSICLMCDNGRTVE